MSTITKTEREQILQAIGNPYANLYSGQPIFAILDGIVERVLDEAVGPCSGCSVLDGPEEDCPRHGRKITEVWEMADHRMQRIHTLERQASVAIASLRGEVDVADEPDPF